MIPFSANGQMLSYSYAGVPPTEECTTEEHRRQVVWKTNSEFDDTMIASDMSRGCSAANFELISKTSGKCFNMFMRDMLDMVKNANIAKGEIVGRWTYCKRGRNYGIKFISE